MHLAAGTRLGPYEITAPLGAGGMGEVYRARDTKLDRDVAIKVLPEVFALDRERLARFEREAKTLAALNHPHIAQIYGFEQAGTTSALVMELVEGEDLAQRIARGAIPVDEALAIAKQIADALEAAHEKGIIHRDLKPANIKLTPDGAVKVLDFGLAKAFEPTSGAAPSSLSMSPTVTAGTQLGVILGTAAYMAPEQARGKPVDRRADIWAFGCVLFEMLTGSRAFEGEDVTETIAAVVTRDPDWSRVPASLPPHVVTLLRRCLEKNVQRRLPHLGVVRLDIDDALRHTDSAPQSTVAVAPTLPSGGPWLTRRAAGGALTVAVILIAGAFMWGRHTAVGDPPLVTRLAIAPPPAEAITVSGIAHDLAISPDGRRAAYVGANGTALLVRDLDRLDALRIDVGGLPNGPFFSPDGQWIGFVDGISAIRKVPVNGGRVETVARTWAAVGATWGDGTIFFAMTGAVYRVPASGGPAEKLTIAGPNTQFSNPTVAPGKRALFVAMTGPTPGIGVIDLDRGTSKLLIPGPRPRGARYVPSGHLVYTLGASDDAQSVWRLRMVRFDLERLEVVGTPTPIEEPIFVSPFGGSANFDVSASGTLVYVSAVVRPNARRLVWVNRDGREEPIDLPARAYTYPTISPDGTQVALDIRDQENDTWIWDVAKNTLRRLTFDPGQNAYVVWTPDGERLVHFRSPGSLYAQRADGRGAPELLVRREHLLAPYGFSPDGKRFVFREDFPETGHDLMMLSLENNRAVTPLLQTGANELNAEISPDGRWLAYESDESVLREVYVRPFPDVTTGRWQVSAAGGRMPRWAKSGQELFFIAPNGALMASAVDTTGAFSSGAPIRVFEHVNYIGGAASLGRTYDVSPDGRRFLMIKPDGLPPNLTVVLNWSDELKAKSK
jgi:Tol biopolymer transport system component